MLYACVQGCHLELLNFVGCSLMVVLVPFSLMGVEVGSGFYLCPPSGVSLTWSLTRAQVQLLNLVA